MSEQLALRLEEGIYQIMAVVPHLLASLGILLAGFAVITPGVLVHVLVGRERQT